MRNITKELTKIIGFEGTLLELDNEIEAIANESIYSIIHCTDDLYYDYYAITDNSSTVPSYIAIEWEYIDDLTPSTDILDVRVRLTLVREC